ncbi:DNA-binding transcriptional regulator, MocR family, contains an aminotransferase domain [Streptoalloteichus tenebrarius]|uniref:DNA-binding transcriptional regulator, MocR family, contains an aminotransferase domain n=1 Tax=Streptoalloteichus tenebrarius (strain ATCC 17920 / DSM 40477 / JCM 4838 / CBS 697.72 / NBRC 16177 / NCIMB 11028 / NRRL B-12390 / A12253. 1 / ISP 5477) TaxID=1933 RepID=Q2MF07_STRSD|nr:PLP-dependent aminotransferase family protein [Streptoalloteichus tenebrarius]MCP2261266.1 DNA-binding transcriptional regulator, MocR family, contains an aminotransferase domain [Streptoalloteichus tenebrarius]BFF04457.1 PLP-dependent aminotransferase family protein [Streptoalloteichus tenebrarius]CAH18565.1 putative aspartate aminotransferase, TobA [Streptoalloteichus tenebrarius]
MADHTSELVPFTRGVPPAEVLLVDELAKLTTQVLEESPVAVFQYAPIGRNRGDERLRAELGRHHGVDPDRIFVSNGSLQVLDLLARHLIGRFGRSVLTEAPTYDRARQIFERHGGQVTGVALRGDGADLDQLRDLVARHTPAFFYTIPDFQNPAGVCMSEEKRRALVGLARQYGFLIVEDTPYRRLRYRGAAAPTLAELAPDRVLTISSLSKVLSPGLRVGYAIGDADTMVQLAELAEGTYLTASPLAQAVAARALEDGLVERSIQRAVTFLAPRHDAAVEAAREAFGDGLLSEPGGGYFVSALVRSDLTEAEFLAAAERAGVRLSRGSAFFPDERLPAGSLFLRLPFQALSLEAFRRGARALADVVARRVR